METTEQTFALSIKQQEMFTHSDDYDTLRMFLIGEMNRFIIEFPRCTDLLFHKMKIKKRVVKHINDNMGIEKKRLRRLKEPYLSVPCIGILWEGGNRMTIVDGNHRIVKLDKQNKSFVNVVVFKYPFWENFLLPDDTVQAMAEKEDLINRESGLIEWEQERLSA